MTLLTTECKTWSEILLEIKLINDAVSIKSNANSILQCTGKFNSLNEWYGVALECRNRQASAHSTNRATALK